MVKRAESERDVAALGVATPGVASPGGPRGSRAAPGLLVHYVGGPGWTRAARWTSRYDKGGPVFAGGCRPSLEIAAAVAVALKDGKLDADWYGSAAEAAREAADPGYPRYERRGAYRPEPPPRLPGMKSVRRAVRLPGLPVVLLPPAAFGPLDCRDGALDGVTAVAEATVAAYVRELEKLKLSGVLVPGVCQRCQANIDGMISGDARRVASAARYAAREALPPSRAKGEPRGPTPRPASALPRGVRGRAGKAELSGLPDGARAPSAAIGWRAPATDDQATPADPRQVRADARWGEPGKPSAKTKGKPPVAKAKPGKTRRVK